MARPHNDNLPPLLDLKQVAGVINTCPRTVESFLRDPAKRFPQPARVGRKRLWIRADIEAWLGQR